jgi:hypothetical protein
MLVKILFTYFQHSSLCTILKFTSHTHIDISDARTRAMHAFQPVLTHSSTAVRVLCGSWTHRAWLTNGSEAANQERQAARESGHLFWGVGRTATAGRGRLLFCSNAAFQSQFAENWTPTPVSCTQLSAHTVKKPIRTAQALTCFRKSEGPFLLCTQSPVTGP